MRTADVLWISYTVTQTESQRQKTWTNKNQKYLKGQIPSEESEKTHLFWFL